MHKRKMKTRGYIVLPVVYTAIFVILCSTGLKPIIQREQSNFRAIWIKGSPTYSFEDEIDLDKLPKDGTISKAEMVVPKSGDMYGKITCEQVGWNAPLYYGDDEIILEQGVGTYAGGFLPGEGGVILAGAHDTTFFANLEQIVAGDVLKVTTTYGIFEYKVYDTKIAKVTDNTAYPLGEQSEMMILYTCYPFGITDRKRDERYYVYAEKINGPSIDGGANE